MEVDRSGGAGAEMDALISDCKFSMKLQMADSAWKQVVTRGRRLWSGGPQHTPILLWMLFSE